MIVKGRMLNKIIFLFFCLVFLFFIYALSEPFFVENKFYKYFSDEIPENFNHFKIVFLTDIHYGPFFSKKRLERLVEKVNKLEPDIILLGGDYVHRDPKYIAPCFDSLRNFRAKYGIYAVLGNHDHWEDAALTRKMILRSGFYLIDNEAYWVFVGKQRIKIGGVGDLWEDKQLFPSLVTDVKNKELFILVSHNPDYAEILKNEAALIDKADLMFSGHTHGGQITFFGLWAPLTASRYGQKYKTGRINIANMSVFVSNGIGTVTPPLRFFARPQIVITELVRK